VATKDWTFQQLGGERKTLALAGRSAPHGRPRKNPVVSDGIKLRLQRVYYPDAIAPPTTHIFGIAYEPWELKGRFADAHLGAGGTKAAIAAWQAFVADAQECLITWGDILTGRGLVTKFKPGRESESESSYELEVEIDEQLGVLGQRPGATAEQGPTQLCEALQLELLEGVGRIPSLPNAGDLKPSFLDGLDGLVSNVNTFSASLVRVAGEIDAFASGTIDQLERLRAGVSQVRTSLNKIRGTIETTENDAAMLARSASIEALWFASRADLDVSTLRALALLDEIDRQAEIAQRGRVLTVYVARTGDTWESIARQFYGGPQSAGKIRDANGVRYGELPVGGRSYQIPDVQ